MHLILTVYEEWVHNNDRLVCSGKCVPSCMLLPHFKDFHSTPSFPVVYPFNSLASITNLAEKTDTYHKYYKIWPQAFQVCATAVWLSYRYIWTFNLFVGLITDFSKFQIPRNAMQFQMLCNWWYCLPISSFHVNFTILEWPL